MNRKKFSLLTGKYVKCFKLNYVRIRDVVQRTCQRRLTIGKSGERGSGISVLPARHDDDDVCREK